MSYHALSYQRELKVGCSCTAISKPLGQINELLQIVHKFQQNLCQTAPSAWKYSKTPICPLTYLNPLQGSTPIINTHTKQAPKKRLGIDLSRHALNSKVQVKIEKQGFGYLWLSKKFHTPTTTKPSFRKVNQLPTKLRRHTFLRSPVS